MQRHRIRSLDDLQSFAREIASGLQGGEVLGLIGDLGAGKTTFTQMLAQELGVHSGVKSPTFVLMQVYETGPIAAIRGIRQMCHVDAYRLKDMHELETIGFADYKAKKDTVTVVEWADRVPELHEENGYIELTFTFGEGDERMLVKGR